MVMITIRVHKGGEFAGLGDELRYVGGSVSEYHQDPDYLSPFDLIINLRRKKYTATNVAIWYMPLGSTQMSERKKLVDDEDIREFCHSAVRSESKTVDVYVEHLIDDPNFRDFNQYGNVDTAREGFCSSDDDFAQCDDIESSSTDVSVVRSSEDEISNDVGETVSPIIINCASNVRRPYMEEDVITDDEAPMTPESSEDDVQDFERPSRKFPSYSRHTNPTEVSFCLLQTFTDAKEFRDAVIKYSIASHRDIRFERSNNVKVCAMCSDKQCHWRIYCSLNKALGRFQVKSYVGEHSCEVGEKVKMCNTQWLTDVYVEKFRVNPLYKAKHLRSDCLNTYGVRVSMHKYWRARYACLRLIQGDQQEHFSKLMDYKLELERSNPGSTLSVDLDKTDPAKPEFRRMYIRFASLVKGWVDGCRPIIGVDGCFLKWYVKGHLLCAIGRDTNNQMYPIAWAVVEVENMYSWEWFLELLLKDIGFHEGVGLTIMSDGQKGLETAMRKKLPYATHRICARHIYANLKRRHKEKNIHLKTLFWAIAKAYSKNEVTSYLEDLRKMSADVYNDVKNSNMSSWCRAYFNDGSFSNSVENNMSESFNSSIKDARIKPVIDMFEEIRRSVMQTNAMKLYRIETWNGEITPKAQKLIDRSIRISCMCNVISNGRKKYEVIYNDDVRIVDMNESVCSCRSWEMTGLPCEHATAVIMCRKESIVEHVSDYYKTRTWAKCYQHVLNPVNGQKEWPRSDEPVVLPPGDKIIPGRPKKNRTKDPHESPTKKGKAAKHGRIMTCQYCLGTGHNTASCQQKQRGEPPTPRPEPSSKRRGRPRSSQPRSATRKRNRETGGKNQPQTWNTHPSMRNEDRMFHEGYGVYYDQRADEVMMKFRTRRYHTDGSVSSSLPRQVSQPTTSSQTRSSQPTTSSQLSTSQPDV